jgi:methyl-accepting chemotaxis protein
MNQLDSATQQNAAMAEETAETLAADTDEPLGLIHGLRVGGVGQAATDPGRRAA